MRLFRLTRFDSATARLRYTASTFIGFVLFYLWPRKTIVSIVSTQRSGSTLLKALLAEAPDISHLPEVRFKGMMNPYRFYYHAFKKSSKRIIVLKNPAAFTDEAYPAQAYPYVRFIILYRNINSWLLSVRRALRESGVENFYQNTSDEQFFQMWLDTYEGIMDRVVKPGHPHSVVSYEELVQNPETVTERLFRFVHSSRLTGTAVYSKPDSFDWRWGRDDNGPKIRALKVVRDLSSLEAPQDVFKQSRLLGHYQQMCKKLRFAQGCDPLEMPPLPRVSVLLPTHNGAAYLREAIDSILNQTFKDFELLIVDDGSTDETESLLRTYHDARIRIVRFQKRQGLVAALNEGLQYCRGDYIARMDADDRSLPRRLEKQVDYLDSHGEVGVCGSWVKLIGAKTGVFRVPSKHDDIFVGLLRSWVVVHPSVMLRKRVLLKFHIRYDADYTHMEDKELWSRLIFLTRFHNLPECLLEYRQHPAQTIHTQFESMRVSIGSIRKKLLSCLDSELNEKVKTSEAMNHFIAGKKRLTAAQLVEVLPWMECAVEKNNVLKIFPEKSFRELIKTWRRELKYQSLPGLFRRPQELWRSACESKLRLTRGNFYLVSRSKQVAFYMQAYKDVVAAEHAIGRLRCFYPEAPIFLVSDGDSDPVYLKLKNKYNLFYVARKERLFLLKFGGRMLHEMCELYLHNTSADYLVRVDTDTRCDRAFQYLPPASHIFGRIQHPSGCLQGGCVLMPRRIVEKFYQNRIFLDARLSDPKSSWGSDVPPDGLADRIQQGLMSFDWILHWACKELEIPTANFEEIHSRWKIGTNNFSKKYAFVHPDKTLHHWNWPQQRRRLFFSAMGSALTGRRSLQVRSR